MSSNVITAADQAYRKVSRHILPITVGMLALALWDRGNVSLAAIQMNADLGLSAAAFGLGAGLFFSLYVFLEVPSNVILARVGARMWMTRIMVSWGIITVLTAFIQNDIQFYIARILLGVAEAGLFPGMIYYLSTWYPDGRRGRAISIFGLGALVSPLLLNPLSGWILEWDTGLPGWRWLFIVSGLITVAFGFIVYSLLPSEPAEARWLMEETDHPLVDPAALGQPPRPHDARPVGGSPTGGPPPGTARDGCRALHNPVNGLCAAILHANDPEGIRRNDAVHHQSPDSAARGLRRY